MTLLDLILNLAALMLWLSWRSVRFDPLAQVSPFSLAGALKRTEPSHFHRWYFLAVVAGLLLARALLNWRIGSAVNWVPHLQLGAIALYFRSDLPGRMALFSALSFGLTMAVFYLWLLLLSLVNGRAADEEPIQKLVRFHLGRIDSWPWPVKLLLPLFATMLLWLALTPILSAFKLIQPAFSLAHRLEEAAIIGLSSYLAWQYLIGGLLL